MQSQIDTKLSEDKTPLNAPSRRIGFLGYWVLGLMGFVNMVLFMNCGGYRPAGSSPNESGASQLPPRTSTPTPSLGPSSAQTPTVSPGPSPSEPPPAPVDQAFCATALCPTLGAQKTRSTFYSIGIELPIGGDTNHNATAELRYRKAGATSWRQGFGLVRMDYTSPSGLVTNGLNGSVLNLDPGTTYDLHLIVRDPDGGVKNLGFQGTTRSLPQKPTVGRTLHVRPGTGTGTGTEANPFRSLVEADTAAAPGDRVLLHAGTYSGLNGNYLEFKKSGTPSQYILYQAAGDGEVTFAHADVYASHIWLEGITFRNQPFALVAKRDVAELGVVISRCRFLDNHYAIHFQLGSRGEGWWIVDNLIDGDNKSMNGSFDGEGIELNETHDHVVMNNSITHVADGISYPGANVDILNNDIFNVTDDLIELDNGLANVRVMGNRVHNGNNNGFSFQPQDSGPWYFIRNQMIGIREGYIKYRQTDRFVFVHNTIVGWDHLDLHNEQNWVSGKQNLTSAIAKNNLFIIATSGKPLAFSDGTDVRFNWRSELDYNGYEWGTEPNPFRYAGLAYTSLAAFSAATGMESHGLRIQRDQCFANLGISGPVPTEIADVRLTLKSGCSAIDKGAILPGINDGYFGNAPDLGAYEYGATAPVIGVRP